ncbi:MAG: ATP-binding protein [Candidatus Bathyarchaeota archaeon]|nr:ATP-binding protein [Candidatus Bathyarchaeota archaeon]
MDVKLMSTNNTNRKLEDAIKTIEHRKNNYGQVMTAFALSKDEKEEWKVNFGRISFLWRGEKKHINEKLDYGNFVLIKNFIDIPESITLLRSIFEKNALKICNFQETPVKASFGHTEVLPSGRRYGYTLPYWPTLYIESSISSETNRIIPQKPLSKIGLPLFPNGTDAIEGFFDLTLPEDGWRNVDNRIEILIPDFRARIKKLQLSGNRIKIVVETQEIAEKELRAKVYCRGENQSVNSGDLSFQGTTTEFRSEIEPSVVEVHIMSAIEGDSIDQRSFNYRYSIFEEDIYVENTQEQIVEMINRGENETTEFKEKLDVNGREFLESVVAFANTKGGRIIIGVDDHCRVKDFNQDVKARIQDLIHGNCDPSVEFQIKEVKLDVHQHITIVEVPEGANKPYSLNNRGIFIRRGSSDRQIKRTELDEIYQNRRS